MNDHSPHPDTAAEGVFTRAVNAVTDGDDLLFYGLHQLAWEAYVRAGAPYGLDEWGLALWWEAHLGAPSEGPVRHP